MASVDEWAAEPPDELVRLREENSALKARVRKAERMAARHARIEEAVIEATRQSLEDTPPKVWVAPPIKLTPKAKTWEEVPQLLLSDWQGGKRTEDYDLDVMAERIARVTTKALHLVADRRHSARIEQLDLCLLGDMVEGETIFAHQPWEVIAPVIDQTQRVAQVIQEAIGTLAPQFKRLRVFGICGNHGRTGSKHSSGSPFTNWDRMSYRVASMLTEQLPRSVRRKVTWEISDRAWHIHDVLGWRILKVHGDQVRGGFAGFPWYGVGRRASGWKDAIPGGYDILLHGHFHTPAMFVQNSSIVFACGSPESRNEYARSELAASGDPSQRLLFVSKAHGVVADHLLWCVERKPFSARVTEAS